VPGQGRFLIGQGRLPVGRHFGAMAIAFEVANVAIFFPDTWRYCVAYVQGGMLVHHGNPYG